MPADGGRISGSGPVRSAPRRLRRWFRSGADVGAPAMSAMGEGLALANGKLRQEVQAASEYAQKLEQDLESVQFALQEANARVSALEDENRRLRMSVAGGAGAVAAEPQPPQPAAGRDWRGAAPSLGGAEAAEMEEPGGGGGPEQPRAVQAGSTAGLGTPTTPKMGGGTPTGAKVGVPMGGVAPKKLPAPGGARVGASTLTPVSAMGPAAAKKRALAAAPKKPATEEQLNGPGAATPGRGGGGAGIAEKPDPAVPIIGAGEHRGSLRSTGSGRRSSVATDEIDARLQAYLVHNSSVASATLRRVNKGWYKYGTLRSVEISIVNNKLMVNVVPDSAHSEGWNKGKLGSIDKFLKDFQNERDSAA